MFDFVRKASNKVVSQTFVAHNFFPCLYLLCICICVCVSHVVKIATEHKPGEPQTAAYLAGSGFPPRRPPAPVFDSGLALLQSSLVLGSGVDVKG